MSLPYDRKLLLRCRGPDHWSWRSATASYRPPCDLSHRDARPAFGQAADGRVLIALTRFDGTGGILDFVPFGLTVPEMAAVMGALGARNAVLLDGGISSQLLIRERGTLHRWRGLRAVPRGLVAMPRE